MSFDTVSLYKDIPTMNLWFLPKSGIKISTNSVGEVCMVTNHIEMPTILNSPPETTVEISFNFVSVLSVLGIFHVKLELFRSMAQVRNCASKPSLNMSCAFLHDSFKIKIHRS